MKNILEYLEYSEQANPSKIAFEDVNNSVTFHELMMSAKRIGSFCAKRTSMRKPVIVFADKKVATIEALMGIVYAGCYYVVLDVRHPIERINRILNTLLPEIILFDDSGRKTVEQVSLDAYKIEIAVADKEAIDEAVLKRIRENMIDIDPLYTNFTSGSTGVPKGVMVAHRSVIDFIDVFTDTFHFSDNDVFGNQAPLDFDVSVKDLYSGIKLGATVELIPRHYFSFPTKLMDYLSERKVTVLTWAVSALCVVSSMEGLEYRRPEYIRYVLFSGEVMPIKHLNRWRKLYPDAMFVNLYGPTEITCNCTYHVLDRQYEEDELLPIGKPFDNERVFLLDDEDHLITEDSVIGEICVAGTAVGLGYVNNKESTENHFTQNPINSGWLEMIYRTGDLGYYSDGLLFFKGRKDFQIKHMGHRIELQEVELAIGAEKNVERCCCLFDEHNDHIIAIYEGKAETKELIRNIKKTLPSIMVPTHFIKIEQLPMTKNGKIDRNQLKSQFIK